jgi:hypothetical protein
MMSPSEDLKKQIAEWTLLAGGGAFFVRYLVTEIIEMLGACVVAGIEQMKKIQKKAHENG